MRLENYKNSEYLPLRIKIQLFLVCAFLTVGFLWLLSSWVDTLHDAYTLTPVVKLSVGDSLGGVIGVGILTYLWSVFFTVIKTGKATKHTWSKKKYRVQNTIITFFFIAGFIVSYFTFFIVNERLLFEGYSVTTKYTNMGIYKTYVKN